MSLSEPEFFSLRATATYLGLHTSVVRSLVISGQLDPVEPTLVAGRRPARYVTTESIHTFVAKARAAGAETRQRCVRCKGLRYVRAGTALCGPCADHAAELAAERRRRRQERKNAWWRENGKDWRDRRALQDALSTDNEGEPHE